MQLTPSLVIFQTNTSVLTFSPLPIMPLHLILLSKSSTRKFYSLSPEIFTDLQLIIKKFSKKFDGFTINISVGNLAGQKDDRNIWIDILIRKENDTDTEAVIRTNRGLDIVYKNLDVELTEEYKKEIAEDLKKLF